MTTLILEIILIVMLVFMVDLFTYKLIRKIDKKEREKLAKKETDYLKKLWAEWDKNKNV